MTVLPVLLLPFYTGAAVMALVFPLFVLVASDAQSQQARGAGMQCGWPARQRCHMLWRIPVAGVWGCPVTPTRLPIFALAVRLTTWIVAAGAALMGSG